MSASSTFFPPVEPAASSLHAHSSCIELELAWHCLQACRPAHLMGITGVGQAALAHLLHAQGCFVSGCDLDPGPLRTGLERAGITVFPGHDPNHIATASDTTWLIRSTAVPPTHPECVAARNRGLPVLQRGVVLAALTQLRPTIAIAGAHGKTSTTTLLTHILRAVGRSVGFSIGAETPGLADAAPGGNEPWLIAEADESDGTLALYSPAIGIITNIEFDHAEFFQNSAALEACYSAFIAACRGPLFYCIENQTAAALCSRHPQAIPYGFHADHEWQVCIEITAPTSQHLAFYHRRVLLGKARLPVAGRHHALNALAAVAAGAALDLDPNRLIAALSDYIPPRRRFETIGVWHGAPIVSDYAHHPTEIRATLDVARQTNRRLVVLFQPHRPSRTAALGPAFAPAFSGADHVILAPVYAAAEPPCPGGDALSLSTHFTAAEIPHTLAASLEDAWHEAEWRLDPKAMLLLIGAGDLERPLLAGRLSQL